MKRARRRHRSDVFWFLRFLVSDASRTSWFLVIPKKSTQQLIQTVLTGSDKVFQSVSLHFVSTIGAQTVASQPRMKTILRFFPHIFQISWISTQLLNASDENAPIKTRECDGVCVWEWLRGDSGSAVTVGPTPSCSFCIYWKSFKPETFPSNLTPIDSQVPPRSSDLSSETSLSLDGSRCSLRCCFQLIFSLSLHFYLAAYIFNDVLRSRTWMIKHHIMKLRVWRRAFSVERLALNVGGWILKWKSCLYVCENIYILSFF